jgi:hypothetical protein
MNPAATHVAKRWVAAVVLSCLAATAMAAANKHLGVATCATSVCHGKLKPVTPKDPGGSSRVALNEYRRWLQEDRHSQAYAVLQSPQSRQIALKLGINNPAGAAVCLNCHADNVPVAQRGPTFHLEDGVGCEACHGGAEKWLKPHSSNTVAHQANLALGMTATESPKPRAALCLSCHAGTEDKFATHAIMGAGHPRLSFELETFVANQPAHYVVDEDYVARKGRIGGATLWVSGQLSAAAVGLKLLKSAYFPTSALYPDFAMYDCDACHHPMTNQRWTPQRAGAGVKPGGPRLQTHNFLVLQVVADTLQPGSGAELDAARVELVRAGQTSPAAISAAVTRLSAWLAAHDAWTHRDFTSAETAQIRRNLVAAAAADRAFDFLAAEQIVLSVQSLSYTLGDVTARKGGIDPLFDAVKSEANFNAAKFAQAARTAQARF